MEDLWGTETSLWTMIHYDGSISSGANGGRPNFANAMIRQWSVAARFGFS